MLLFILNLDIILILFLHYLYNNYMLFRYYLDIIFTWMLAAAPAAAVDDAAWIILWAYVDFKMLSLRLDIYTLHVLWLW